MEIQFKMTVDPSNPATSALLMQLLQNQPQQINSGAPQQAQEPTPQPVINLSVTPSTKAEKSKAEKVKPAVVEAPAEIVIDAVFPFDKETKAAPAVDEVAQEPTSEPTEKPMSLEALREAVGNKGKEKPENRQKLKDLLATFGVETLPLLAEDKRNEFFTKMQAI